MIRQRLPQARKRGPHRGQGIGHLGRGHFLDQVFETRLTSHPLRDIQGLPRLGEIGMAKESVGWRSVPRILTVAILLHAPDHIRKGRPGLHLIP